VEGADCADARGLVCGGRGDFAAIANDFGSRMGYEELAVLTGDAQGCWDGCRMTRGCWVRPHKSWKGH
jgi:hypothetical protein